jgi:hypothetical protein
LNGTQTNPVYKWLIGLLPELDVYLHPCPYQGNLRFEHLSVDLKMVVSSFPAGTYMITGHFYNDDDDNNLTVKIALDVTSNDQNEF